MAIQSTQPKQRAAIAAPASFVPAHKISIKAPGVLSLSFGIVDTLSEIEPDDCVTGAMSLRLSFMAKGSQRNRKDNSDIASDNRRCDDTDSAQRSAVRDFAGAAPRSKQPHSPRPPPLHVNQITYLVARASPQSISSIRRSAQIKMHASGCRRLAFVDGTLCHDARSPLT